jgi:hypothetical protein
VIARLGLALLLLAGGATVAPEQRHRNVPPPAPRRRVVPAPKRRTVAPPVVVVPSPASPVQPAVPAATIPSGNLSVTLVTFGPGEEVWERFGHNALWIHDERAGTDVTYNWGLFDFDQPDFVKRFLSGDTKYWMDGEDAFRMIAAYHDIGRPITLQRLNLTQAQAQTLDDFVRTNALEENKYYRYDYFRDNCSTRLRDALDLALDGDLRRATDTVPTTLTYRSESLRLTSADIPIEAGIDVALGRRADVPLTQWQSFFIPMRLRDALRSIKVPAPDGSLVPLVIDDRRIAPTSGPVVTVPSEPPQMTTRNFLIGIVLAAIVLVLRLAMRSRRAAAWGLALLGFLWSLLTGAIGALLVYMWVATRHVFWAWNENLFVASPLSLLLVILLPVALLRSRGVRRARVLSLLVAGLGLVALVLSLIPGGQSSLAVVALFLPVHLAFAWALVQPLPEPVFEAKDE